MTLKTPEHDQDMRLNAVYRRRLREQMRRKRHSEAAVEAIRKHHERAEFVPFNEARYLQELVAQDGTALWVLPETIAPETHEYLLCIACALKSG